MRIYKENGMLKKDTIQHDNYFLWKEGLICFYDEPVGKILEKLQLYYDIKLMYKTELTLKNRYSGKFRTKDGGRACIKGPST